MILFKYVMAVVVIGLLSIVLGEFTGQQWLFGWLGGLAVTFVGYILFN